jgi:hypothetical protein
MISIIKDYLTKIAVHSESLSRTEKFINKPWVHIDNNGNYQKYIFNPNGDLYMSFNGKGEKGKWEYLSQANLIFIDRLTDKIFLKQSFFDEAVMILKTDGTNEDLFILANENIIPNLDVIAYLSSLIFDTITPLNKVGSNTYYQKTLINGGVLSINRGELNNTAVGMDVLLNDKVVPNGDYFAPSGSNNKLIGYHIVNSKIKSLFWNYTYLTSKGTIKINLKSEYDFSLGDSVFLNDNPAPNGKYKLEFMCYISVTNGVISGTSLF